MAVKSIKQGSGLTLKQKLFCNYYVSYEFAGNAGAAYAKAYGFDFSDPKQNATARSNASRLLTNANILKETQLEIENLKPNRSDFENNLYFMMTQFTDLKLKVKALSLGYKWLSVIKFK